MKEKHNQHRSESQMSQDKKLFQRKKQLLFVIHGVDPREGTHNVHHIIKKSDGGSNDWDNLSLLPIDFHEWIHKLEDRIEKRGKER